MPHDRHARPAIDRRTFVKASLIPAAIPIAASLASSFTNGAEPAPAGPEIIDTNVHLFQWPFRKLKYDRTEALIARLKRHRITQAWAGSFEAVLHKQLDQVNRRLAEECAARGNGLFVPIGSVNPAWSDWDEDLRRCHEQYKMPGVRLYPAYHGYALDQPEFGRLIAEAAKRELLVQIVLRMEDERVHHQAIAISTVNVAPLVDILKKSPQAKVQLINSAGPLLGNNVESWRETKSRSTWPPPRNGGVGVDRGKELQLPRCDPLSGCFRVARPFFPRGAVLKLFESPLSLEQLETHAGNRAIGYAGVAARRATDGLERPSYDTLNHLTEKVRPDERFRRPRICPRSGRLRPADARRPGQAADLGHALPRFHDRRHPLPRREPVLCGTHGNRTDALSGHRRHADRSAGHHDPGERNGKSASTWKTRRSRFRLIPIDPRSPWRAAARSRVGRQRLHRHQILRRQSGRGRRQPSRQRRDHPAGG
jgi:hypothetical protein